MLGGGGEGSLHVQYSCCSENAAYKCTAHGHTRAAV